MLALDAGTVVSAGRLIEGVWEEPPETASTALQGHVSQLRRVLGESAIVTRAPGYVLDATPEAVDAVRCEHALERARAQLADGKADAAAATLRDALELWRGEPLADLADAPFAREALPALRELRVALEEERLEAELARGHHAETIAPLRELVAHEPLRERPRAQLMLALYRAGRQAEALDVYEAGRRVLSEELGIEPGERIRALHESIVRQDETLGAPPPSPARPAPPPPSPSRRRWILPVAGAAALAAAIAIAIAAGGGASPQTPQVTNGLLRIGAGGARSASAPLDGTPSSVAAANGHAWVLDADGQTVTEVDGDGKRLHTFATGATPTDITASRAGLWMAQGRATGSQFPGAQTTEVAHVDQRTAALVHTTGLPRGRAQILPAQRDRIAASARAVWVLRNDGALIRIDPLSHLVVKVLRIGGVGVTATTDAAWVLTRDGALVRVSEQGSALGPPIDVGDTGGSSIAAGGGAIWVVDVAQGILAGYDDRDGTRSEPVDVGAGAGPVAYGGGTVWVAQPARQTVLRVDPDEQRVVGEVRVSGTPRDMAADGRDLWVSITSPSATASACAPMRRAAGTEPDALVAADVPLQTNGRSPIVPVLGAIQQTLARNRYRAGSHRLGLLVCDDSTAQSGTWDAAKCRANARAYAANRKVVAVIGPYNSPCAREQLPIAAAAPGGPLAMVSPTSTDPLLNRPGANTPVGAFARVVATDERQAKLAARFLRERGHRRVFVLDDGDQYTLNAGSYFAAAARGVGMTVVGRGTWHDPRQTAGLLRRVRRSRPDVVYVSGLLDNGAGRVIHSLRELVPSVTLAGNEGLLPVGRLYDRAGAAATGVLIATGSHPSPAPHPFADLATRATEAALTAIARSDGSRRSVARALRAEPQFDSIGDLRHAPVTILRAARPGGSRQNMSLEGAQVVATLR
jgi:DNA-binding SARP family transcriptional activator/ABC-type branched-subunit amino acid transport system substrate-binding protein